MPTRASSCGFTSSVKHYGESTSGAERRVIVEFVSANPTGPLTVAHGRHAAYGATLANLLAAVGYRIHREFYVNDAGRQMDILAVSVWLRYLRILRRDRSFPGERLSGRISCGRSHCSFRARWAIACDAAPADVLAALPADESAGGDKDVYIDALIERARALIGDEALQRVLDLSRERLLGDMREDLREFGVVFDRWYSERSLSTSGAIERALAAARVAGQPRTARMARVWFRATAFGDEKDRVVVRENGQKTYFASDIAYHLVQARARLRAADRRARLWTSRLHRGVRAGLAAMGEPPASPRGSPRSRS